MFKIVTKFFVTTAFVTMLLTSLSFAQNELILDTEVQYKARVTSVDGQYRSTIPGTEAEHSYQQITAEILDKDKKGERVTIDNDYVSLETGDIFYIKYVRQSDGSETYTVSDIYRIPVIITVLAVFVVLVLVLAGWHGVMALLSLGLSYAGMHFVLFPGLLAGYNPVLVASGFAFVTLLCVLYVTHGINRKTHSAFLGAFISIILTVLLSYIVVMWSKLSGFTDDEAIYLNFSTNGQLDFQGLLLGAIIIGVIGIIDDVAITQASVVSEIKNLSKNLSRRSVFKRAMHVGKDHTSAVVNSLVLAYAGASLPLVLLMYTSNIPIIELINKESISTEIIRTLIGSIGLVLTVPITTMCATLIVDGSERGTHTHHH